ncbi:MAG: alkaline phosphatase [Ruminococcaceae bacterium]|nr:alkaline phosphatase [Oscillospiraceae bacterium]
MMKRLTALLLALLLALSLCACKPEGDYGFSEPEWMTDAPPESETQQTDVPTPSVPEPTVEEYITGIISAEYTEPKNVILIIGDGMGINDLLIAEKYSDGLYDFGLVMNKITNKGLVTTGALDNAVTDSAASGTALSTGTKTNLGYIGKAADGTDLEVLAEFARKSNKKIGIVTDDELFGATPASFVTHNISRYNYGELAMGMLNFAPEVMIGSSYDNYFNNLTEEGKTALNEKYAIAQSLADFETVSTDSTANGKYFAGFNGGCTTGVSEHLAISAKTALSLLENENGFFLMIEGCGTDVFGHSNTIDGKKSGVLNLDKTVEAVLVFMQSHPDTLLIITSDHETGGVSLPEEGKEPDASVFTTTTHTAAEVRVFAVGKGSEFFLDKTVDNTEIAAFIKNALTEKNAGTE